MSSFDASSVASLLREFAQRTALHAGNPFRAKAYARAADNLLALSLPLDRVIAEDRLREIPGIGIAIEDIVKRLHTTGTHPALEKMRMEIPAGVLEMLTIPGMQADKVLKLHHELGLSSLAELEEAAREDRLQKIKGLGASFQTKVLRGIEMQSEAQGRRHMHRAAELLKSSEKHLREMRPDIIRVIPAGDFRRGCELVGELSLVAEVAKRPHGPQTIAPGGQLTTHLTDIAHYGVTLLLATGSEAHLASLRTLAAERNMSLDESGLWHAGELIAAASEDGIYRALGMQPVPPELREGRDEVARALAGTLPELVTDADIVGILHAHTDRCDGLDTLQTMAEATLNRGYRYFGTSSA
jgi:DNA polymerase (family X)